MSTDVKELRERCHNTVEMSFVRRHQIHRQNEPPCKESTFFFFFNLIKRFPKAASKELI